MRKIMFRVFDKEEGRFRRFDGRHDSMMIDRDGKASYYNLQNGSGGDEYIVEQFTGMLDKNGRRIFEGDILEVELAFNGTTRKALYVVGYANSSFTLSGIKGSLEGLGLLPHIMEWLVEDGESNIVGNIHDNPELLEDFNAR